jgi:hypothetical protein
MQPTPIGDSPANTDPIPLPDESTPETEDHLVPRGAFYFALLLIIGYAIYFFLIWHEIVILRGGA